MLERKLTLLLISEKMWWICKPLLNHYFSLNQRRVVLCWWLLKKSQQFFTSVIAVTYYKYLICSLCLWIFRLCRTFSKSVLPVSSNANTLRRKPAVIGKKSTADGLLKLKVFTAPRTFYFYEGNLDVSVKSEYLTDYSKKLEYMSLGLHVVLSIRPDLWILQLFALYLLMFKLTLKTKTKWCCTAENIT